jgi:hypothetical protein
LDYLSILLHRELLEPTETQKLIWTFFLYTPHVLLLYTLSQQSCRANFNFYPKKDNLPLFIGKPFFLDTCHPTFTKEGNQPSRDNPNRFFINNRDYTYEDNLLDYLPRTNHQNQRKKKESLYTFVNPNKPNSFKHFI